MHGTEHAAHKAGDALGNLDPVHQLDKAAQEAVDRIIKPAVASARKEVQGAIKKVEKEIPKIAEQVVEEIKRDLQKLWASGLIDKVIDIAEGAVPKATSQRISFLEFRVNIREKIGVFQRLSHRLPRGRKEIVKMVVDLIDGDEVIIHVDARFISSSLGADIAIPIPLDKLVKERR